MLAPNPKSEYHGALMDAYARLLRGMSLHARKFLILGAISVVPLLTLTVGLGIGAESPNPCPRVEVSPSPGWVVSSAWDLRGDNLVMVDNLFDRILRYDLSGRPHGGLPDFVGRPLDDLGPLGAANGGSSLLVKLNGDRFVRLGADYGPQEQVDLHRDAVRDGWKVTSAFQFAPANGDVITFSDLQGPGPSDWKSAFVRVPLADPGAFEVLEPTFDVHNSEMRNFYKLGYPYVTSLGSTAYVLLMDADVGLYRNSKASGNLEPLDVALPAGLSKRPKLGTYFGSAVTFADTMKGVEGATMPAGIYGWKGSLYMLARRPGMEGTNWSLLKINPLGGENAVIANAMLQTHANHLIAVPGPKRWAFIEKGPVESFDRQDVRSVFFVPSPLIGNLQSGVLCQQ